MYVCALAVWLAAGAGAPPAGAQSLAVVPASTITGPAICKPGFGPPQCSAAPFDPTSDLAYQGNGFALPSVAKDNIPGFVSIHQPHFANDGFYGNGASWISDSTNSWIKIDLGRTVLLDRLTLGRDRLGGFDDRDPGQFTISIATSDNVYANGDDSNDGTEYTVVLDSAALGFSGIISGPQTIQASFPAVPARYIKVTVANFGTAIDELEAFGSADETCVEPPSGLVTWWPGNGNADDIFGGRHGTLQGGATFAPGRVGDAFSFNGMTSYVDAPGLQDVLITNQITIAAWVNATAYAGPNGYCCAHIVGLDTPGVWMTHFAINPSNPYLWTNNGLFAQDPSPLALGQWQHLVATFDGTTAKWYTDGVLRAQQSFNGVLPIGTTTRIGAAVVEFRPFNGLIDEVQIFDRALTTQEIQSVFAAGSAGMCSALAPGPFAYVSNFNDHTVSVIDTANNVVTATIPLPEGFAGTARSPLGVAVHPTRNLVYVANVGNSLRGAGFVSVIDRTTNTVTANITEVPGSAIGFCGMKGAAVNPSGTRLYVQHVPECGGGFAPFQLVVVDTATNEVISVVDAGFGDAWGIAVNPAGTRVYMANPGTDTVSVIDTVNETLIAQVPVGSFPYGIAVHPSGTKAYVGNLFGNSVSVIDTSTNTAIATIPAGLGASAVAVNPAGTQLYVANSSDNTVSVIDTATNTVIATVPVGTAPVGVSVNPTGTRAYVVNSGSNNVSAIDTATNAVIATVGVGSGTAAFGQFIAPVITNASPVADAGPDQTVIAGESLILDGTGSSDPDGTIVSFDWAFGDGGMANGAIVGHVYTTAGQFTATLTVTDDDGATDDDTAVVTVQSPSQAIDALSDLVASFNFQQGISNSLDAKLENVQEALQAANAGQRGDAANKLNAFINAVNAQRGNEITDAQADELIALAMRILAVL